MNTMPRPWSLGAPPAAINPNILGPCDAFTLVLKPNSTSSSLSSLPAQLTAGSSSGTNLLGQTVVDGVYRGTGPYALPLWFSQFTVVTFKNNGKSPGCTVVAPGSGIQNPPPKSGVFTRVPGHRIRTTVTVTGGPFPSADAGQTVQSMQVALNAQLPGQYTVVSVTYPNATTLVIDADYCGPQKTTPSPTVVMNGGVSVASTFQDLGPSPQPCGGSGSGMSTGTKVAIVAGVGAAGLGIALGWKRIKRAFA